MFSFLLLCYYYGGEKNPVDENNILGQSSPQSTPLSIPSGPKWILNFLNPSVPQSLKTTMYYSPETTRPLRAQLSLSCAVSAPSRDLHVICHLSCCLGIFHSLQCVLRSHPCHRTRLLQILRQSTTGETQAERVRTQNGRMGFAYASHRSLVPACHCIHIFKTEFFKYNKQF